MHPSYPNYRATVCGRNCVFLRYLRHGHTIPKWVTMCDCHLN